MKNILNKIRKIDKKYILVVCIFVIAIFLLIINSTSIINRIKEIFEKEELIEFEYKTYEVNGNIGTVLVTIRNEEGLKKVNYLEYNTNEPFQINAHGKTQLAFDYKMEDRKQYKIEVQFENGNNKTYTIDYEIPRIKGNYTLVGSTYANEPELSGLKQEKTRYLYLNESKNLIPGNWINKEAPANWYNYEKQEWANIYVENNGMETYFVWIPRYCYKKDTDNSTSGNERMDVKFINTYNEYINGVTRRKANLG